ncbi:MAG: outer membrane beta-barrel protein [Nitratireductor sp.]
MGSFRKITLAVAVFAASAAGALAADIIEPPVYEAPPEVTVSNSGGWYLRGDIGYSHVSVAGVSYYQGAVPNPILAGFEQHDVDATWMLSGGIGYQVNDYFRVDWTLDHYFASDFTGSSAQNVACSDGTVGAICSYSDNSSLGLTTLMANAYLDLGNYKGFTPYVGFGLGGAHTHWGDLTNQEYQVSGPAAAVFASDTHGAKNGWRFAYALHTGASYDLTSNLKLDAGYTFTHVSGGDMFGFGAASGDAGVQGYHDDIKIHTVKAGLRYSFN